MVETADIELAAHHADIETSLLLSQEREFSGQLGGLVAAEVFKGHCTDLPPQKKK